MDKPWREIKRNHAGERICEECGEVHPNLTHYEHTDMVPRRKIVRSREQEGAHNTGSLEIARQHSAHVNRPLTQAEKRERTPMGWVLRQEE